MAKCYDPAFADFDRASAAVRRELASADVMAVHRDAVARDRAALTKAFAYVWAAAALEEFVRTVLRALARELNSYAVPTCDLRPSLFTLLRFGGFDSLRDLTGLKHWSRRVELVGAMGDTGPAAFSDVEVPLDKRTLRPDHFAVLWSVYGFDGDSLPGPRHALGLNELADGRNDVAHGHVNPLDFGRRKALVDVSRMLEQTEDIVLHLAGAIDGYLATQTYKK